LPEGITTIGLEAFNDCENLKSITLPKSIDSIGIRTFAGCSSLTSIQIPDGVTCIEDYAFSGCSALRRVLIPKSVTDIYDSAFLNCNRIATVSYSGTADDWDAIIIEDNNECLTNAQRLYNSTALSIPGDINGDSSVNTKDLVRMMKGLSTKSTKSYLDVNGDDKVNLSDLLDLIKYLANPNSAEIN
jgi:hypothetical protein